MNKTKDNNSAIVKIFDKWRGVPINQYPTHFWISVNLGQLNKTFRKKEMK